MLKEKKEKTKKRKPEEKEKDEIFKLLADKYREAPADLWSHFPDIASRLDKFISPKKPTLSQERPFYFYLTERERDFRLNFFSKTLDKFRKGEGVTKEEAVKALEDAAALQKYASGYKDAILKLLETVLEFPFGAKQETIIHFQKGKPEHHFYNFARGITFSLTWDGKLIKITFDPKEFAIRQKLLSFVGMGSDTVTDVARRHNDYLEDAFGH